VFDIPAAGGFFLGDRPEALERLFPGIGTSIGCGGPDEMACRADDFLRRPAERKRIADRLRETVRRDHTYERRMHSLLEVLADRA
jgi:spore maturation protein CgeB